MDWKLAKAWKSSSESAHGRPFPTVNSVYTDDHIRVWNTPPSATPLCHSLWWGAYDCVASCQRSRDHFFESIDIPFIAYSLVPSLFCVRLFAYTVVNFSRDRNNTPPQFICGMVSAHISDIFTRYATYFADMLWRFIHPLRRITPPFSSRLDVFRQVVWPFWHNINLVFVVYKTFQ